MNKKEIIELLEKKEVKHVSIEDTWGSYRDSYIIYADGEKVYFQLGYRSEDAVRKYMELNNIEFTS